MNDRTGQRFTLDESQVPQVRALVAFIVSHLPEPEARRLVEQAQTISALTGNLAFISYRVDKQATTASPATVNPITVSPEVLDKSGSSSGFILVWTDDEGYLDSLEYTWWESEVPVGLPKVANLSLKYDQQALRRTKP